MLSVIIIVVLVCSLLYIYVQKWGRYLELAGLVPTYKGCYPVIGHLYKLVGGRRRLWENLLKVTEYMETVGGVLSVWLGPTVVFIVTDPDDALTVTNTCLEKSYFYKFVADFLGNGLVTAEVATWKRIRKLLNPTFSQHVLLNYLNVFNRQAALLAKDLETMAGAGKFDPTEFIGQRTLETVCETAVGVSLDDKSFIDEKYKEAIETGSSAVATRIASFWLHPHFIYRFAALRRTMHQARAIMQNMSRTVLYKRRAEREKDRHAKTLSSRFIPFLDLLLDMRENGSITDDQIRHQLDTIIAAGFDTSVRALLSVMVLIGTHQHVQEKVYEEIMSVVGPSADLCKEDVAKLVYTEAVFKEALRFSPVVPLVVRKIDREVKLKNYTLPAGSDCVVLFWGILRHPIWGPDRLEFRPERWLDPSSLPESPGAYSAFSLGKRNCIGKPYAILAQKALLVHLVRKYRIWGDYSKVARDYDILLKYVEGNHITLELRK